MAHQEIDIQSMVPERWGIDSARVVLLPPDADQDRSIARLLSDPTTMQFLPFMTKPSGYTSADAATRRQHRDEIQKKHKQQVNFSIALKRSQIPEPVRGKMHADEFLPARSIPIDNGTIEVDEEYAVVGCCGLSSISGADRGAEAGIILDARFWRSGVSSAALYLTLQYGFEQLGLHRIVLLTTGKNVGMRGWMEKVVGVQVESVRKDVIYLGGGEYLDSWDYAVFDHDWVGHSKRDILARIEPASK
ncbi:hypothetical protein GGI15_001748 [Coemansia interrupta]|uniref:N-acetyltransferase domain-containing protein n=1 Tax=Coemansia interrupta TaxID=1126814 RepID=A0A9W8LND3_9FUNG|nr:hypothetical protein GGI15_001748 [Coemansia interrupta]